MSCNSVTFKLFLSGMIRFVLLKIFRSSKSLIALFKWKKVYLFSTSQLVSCKISRSNKYLVTLITFKWLLSVWYKLCLKTPRLRKHRVALITCKWRFSRMSEIVMFKISRSKVYDHNYTPKATNYTTKYWFKIRWHHNLSKYPLIKF